MFTNQPYHDHRWKQMKWAILTIQCFAGKLLDMATFTTGHSHKAHVHSLSHCFGGTRESNTILGRLSKRNGPQLKSNSSGTWWIPWFLFLVFIGIQSKSSLIMEAKRVCLWAKFNITNEVEKQKHNCFNFPNPYLYTGPWMQHKSRPAQPDFSR